MRFLVSCLRLLIHHVAQPELALCGTTMSHNTTERAVTRPIVVGRVHNPILSCIGAIKDLVSSNERKFFERPSIACTIKSEPPVVAEIVRKVA
jgi:hypothetical protein